MWDFLPKKFFAYESAAELRQLIQTIAEYLFIWAVRQRAPRELRLTAL